MQLPIVPGTITIDAQGTPITNETFGTGNGTYAGPLYTYGGESPDNARNRRHPQQHHGPAIRNRQRHRGTVECGGIHCRFRRLLVRRNDRHIPERRGRGKHAQGCVHAAAGCGRRYQWESDWRRHWHYQLCDRRGLRDVHKQRAEQPTHYGQLHAFRHAADDRLHRHGDRLFSHSGPVELANTVEQSVGYCELATIRAGASLQVHHEHDRG